MSKHYTVTLKQLDIGEGEIIHGVWFLQKWVWPSHHEPLPRNILSLSFFTKLGTMCIVSDESTSFNRYISKLAIGVIKPTSDFGFQV